MVLDVSTAWQTLQNSKRNKTPMPDHMYDTDELKQRLEKARNG